MTVDASFYRRAEDALADRALQGKVQRATGRLTAGRAAGFAALEGADAVRDRARAIRADVVAHLDQHLATFAERLTALGGHVHWAADAEEAVRIVAGIATSRGVRTAVKSKSMVSEEIELNPGLERAGVRRRRDRPRRVGRAARRTTIRRTSSRRSSTRAGRTSRRCSAIERGPPPRMSPTCPR